MGTKYLVVITSGLDQKDKMIVGMNFAKNTFRKKKADDVKVVFFGPSEKAFSSNDSDFLKLFSILKDLGIVTIACSGYSKAHDLDKAIMDLSTELEDVSETIPRYVDAGYTVMTF
ncbi:MULTISPECIES: hypothetical protein [Acidiplasma]|uniref:DsrE family protein n=3 Tax=Acidiplasma TaxID=507753 RepID=A0A0Q0VRJ7_9ARCH|nr:MULTISPECIES: hypothetical protein [Acidiplasma]KJE49225.1 hypothetical protein TZ01_03925 [Acidiplasma sp. MBA-1]KPV46958.1 hypothetical protein SE19_03170 [Acidiplasma aeolicum]KQB36494.1 hypothetical protein AOG55_03975 [Acidiplasma cupricumulans]WMT54809.1 MAG: hypothetical protein RE470_07820 [Acidiplasma sp.]